uniref:Classical arabinogalactan protein 4-like isoform X2 n=1 Tax=Nicotiana sylvestris TaxID=4096 RepID=A0A1U7VJ87_NICSY|nr:PREDICTED: classical arabinogalactan protein 4-like isoform X2 [Nicotiana sylvestris]
MASSTSFKIFLLLALFATSCIAQSPVPAPKISPTASPTPTLGPSPSSLPVSPSSPTPAGPGASPAGQPAADVPPAPNSGNRAVFGGAAFAGALIVVALL